LSKSALSCGNRKDCPTIRPNLTPLAIIEIHLALPSAARVWDARGMANWRVGAPVMCSKDYGDCNQGFKGIIIESRGSWTVEWVISYSDGAKQLTISENNIGKHFVLI
jgi:hypothetical protein